MAARVLHRGTGTFCAVTITIPNPLCFRHWRVESRNFVDHHRRMNSAWRAFGCHVFHCQDGRLRGVMTLGKLDTVEVMEAFNTRWPTTLKEIDPVISA
jgi:hypothetical protein